MPPNLSTPLATQLGGLVIQRVIGAVALLLGLALSGLVLSGAVKLLTQAGAGTTIHIFIAVVAVLAAFFISVGWRMTFNRPNRHGSLLTPGLWYVISALFIACAMWMGYLVVAKGQSLDLEAHGGALAFGVLAAMAGWRAARKTADCRTP